MLAQLQGPKPLCPPRGQSVSRQLARRGPEITDDEFLGLLRQLRDRHLHPQPVDKRVYSHYFYEMGDSCHRATQLLACVDWTTRTGALANFLAQGERLYLVGEDLGFDAASDVTTTPGRRPRILDALQQMVVRQKAELLAVSGRPWLRVLKAGSGLPVLDLNAWFVQWWKTGQEPTTDHDRVYFSYRKYPHGAKLFPFQPKQGDAKNRVLEVLTILTAPAQVRLPGRDAQWDAPAGMSFRQFPLTPGPVSAELVRAGHVVLRLESPEPITDRPFRETNAITGFSTEFLRHWKADFGDAPPLLRGEYADDDQDGLPNWFEMYWFGKFLDWSTATVADPKSLGRDGKTNLQHYLDQTAPVDFPSTGLSGKQ